MKIYIAYKFSNADQEKLRQTLEKTSSIIEELGHESFIFLRDCENWNPKGKTPKWIMQEATKNLQQCDMLLALVESQEKGEGMLIESGFAKGLGKKVIVAKKPEGRAILLKAISDYDIEYTTFDELKEKLNATLKKEVKEKT
jgi:nucleoside 2-deoxyribosyltransferase